MIKWNNIYAKLYYDLNSAVSYNSFSVLWKKVKQDKKDKKISKNDSKQWLKQQYTYSLHKPYKKSREYRKTVVSEIDVQWQADLVTMREFSDFNDGYNYLLCVVDCHSQFAWCQKLKTKTGVKVKKALNKF